MSTTTEGFKTELIGVTTDPFVWEVTQENVARYAAATNDTIAPHASGDLAPPVYAIVPAFQALGPTMAEVIPPELIMMGVHGEQDFRFHKPIVPGMTLTTTAHAAGVTQKSSGVTVLVKGETRDQDGDLVVEQYMTSFVRRAEGATDAGQEPPDHTFPEELRDSDPVAVVEQSFDADQTFRYSEASGDLVPIHLDDDVAKAVGLPGIIIHGLCTMAFVSRVVIEATCPEDPTRLKRLAVQFSKIVLPSNAITTSVWKGGEADGRDVFHFETLTDAGAACIKNGLAEVAR
ncbi:MaoC/PaaZ C-terminal domain-containing protein [Paraconexibacter sp.]|uniref:MaoC/PaaZ C-terminal domain-containing protein n=1 Tax=Paraconexibacter sp. TaxID=2949640 RepID=UPI003563E7C0